MSILDILSDLSSMICNYPDIHLLLWFGMRFPMLHEPCCHVLRRTLAVGNGWDSSLVDIGARTSGPSSESWNPWMTATVPWLKYQVGYGRTPPGWCLPKKDTDTTHKLGHINIFVDICILHDWIYHDTYINYSCIWLSAGGMVLVWIYIYIDIHI